MLWAAAGVAVLGFLVTMEAVARHYALRGPLTSMASEVIVAPYSGPALYGGLALTMVVLTWRQRAVAAAAAIGIDLVFLVVRLIIGSKLDFGNGALWVIIACAVIALTRLKGSERLLMLKGVGLGMLLITGHKTGATWLLITSTTRPQVLDPYVAAADHALGDPSWLVGRFVEATDPFSTVLLNAVYGQLPLAAAVFALYQLRHVAVERRFPGHHLMRTFLVIGLLGPGIYMLFPVVGPIYAYGADGGQWALADLWPGTLPPITGPHSIPFDEITPRNCMPSLHTAWATAIFIHSRKAARPLRWAGTFWLVGTLTATLGFGYHYGADIIAGVVFTLTIDAALRAFDRGWDWPAVRLVGHGTAVFVALLVSYRFLPVEMAARPWLFGPLLLLATGSVITAYVLRYARVWDPKPVPPLQPSEPQPVQA
ncbi:hypothetical protein SRB5_46060 [Streptomyces sp. RB5]|uniref:Inositol phosphorylceramide synthase n=1 Tax=Streptomyces smaragdinus TaxID=2585196 RepID=A0A7K0CLS1_9ACTN|nr:phosphatase PAP2 family protein [Streptomyces smaragdinus]MQY14439.1 hypothetical protein [Streptomyces smaragdinus]